MPSIPEDEYEERIQRAQLARQEGRETISEQTDTLADIDEKASRIFRLNLLLLSVLASGFSVALSEYPDTYEKFLTSYMQFGTSLLFLSMILASVTYTSTASRIGIARGAIDDSILNQNFDYDLVEEEIAKEYGRMIHENYKRNATNVLLFTFSLMSVVGAITYLAIGLVDISLSNGFPHVVNIVVIVFFLIFGKMSGIYGTYQRWKDLTSPYVRFRSWRKSHEMRIYSILKNYYACFGVIYSNKD
jgi:hypothetical protein